MDDATLLGAIAARRQDALMALYARYGAAVYGMALRITSEPASAEEVTQDVFLKIWRQPSRWDPALGRFSSWLLATTRNAAIDQLRHDRRRPVHAQAVDESSPAVAEASPFDSPMWSEGHELRRLTALLPGEQRTLIELAFYQGYTHSELAILLNLPLGTVKTRLRTALHRLRELWEAGGAA